jgi:four helix bundle protein
MAQVPEAITSEEMWQFYGYRKALFFHDVCWQDCEKLTTRPLGKAIAQQLVRSAGSISANIEEGYGRGLAGKERLYFLRVALGSARESKGWYYRAKALLAPEVLAHRLSLISEVIALLVTEINRVVKKNKRANE